MNKCPKKIIPRDFGLQPQTKNILCSSRIIITKLCKLHREEKAIMTNVTLIK